MFPFVSEFRSYFCSLPFAFLFHPDSIIKNLTFAEIKSPELLNDCEHSLFQLYLSGKGYYNEKEL